MSEHEKIIADLEAENARLRAIVDRLPKTADGVPILPGDRVFSATQKSMDGKEGAFLVAEIFDGDGWLLKALDDHCGPLYSTRAAADEAAKKGGTQ